MHSEGESVHFHCISGSNRKRKQTAKRRVQGGHRGAELDLNPIPSLHICSSQFSNFAVSFLLPDPQLFFHLTPGFPGLTLVFAPLLTKPQYMTLFS